MFLWFYPQDTARIYAMVASLTTYGCGLAMATPIVVYFFAIES